jgi:hypothetical protein
VPTDNTPAHYRYSPSSSKRWIACPGSAQADLPDRESEASREGTLAHALGYAELTGTEVPNEMKAEVAALGLTEDQQREMAEHVLGYVKFIRELPGEKLYEVKLASDVLSEFGGTIDCLRLDGDMMHVVDLKYGFGRVQANGNHQLKSYLCLAREHFEGARRYAGTIYQPRLENGITTAEFTDADLDEHFCAVMDAIMSDEFVAGEHCKWCPLLLNCDTAHQNSIQMADVEFSEIQEGPSVERLEAIISFTEVMEERAKLARMKLFEMIKNGQLVRGWKIAQGKKHRTWRNEGVAMSTLRLRYREKFDNLIKLKTPAQVEKHVAKSVLDELDLWHRPDGELRLMKEGSENEALDFENEFDIVT